MYITFAGRRQIKRLTFYVDTWISVRPP